MVSKNFSFPKNSNKSRFKLDSQFCWLEQETRTEGHQNRFGGVTWGTSWRDEGAPYLYFPSVARSIARASLMHTYETRYSTSALPTVFFFFFFFLMPLPLWFFRRYYTVESLANGCTYSKPSVTNGHLLMYRDALRIGFSHCFFLLRIIDE